MKEYTIKENDYCGNDGVFCFSLPRLENIPIFLSINWANTIHECYLIDAQYSTKSNEYIVLYKKM